LAGVRDGLVEEVEPLWIDNQLGLTASRVDLTVERPTPKIGVILEEGFPEI
jgi:hypothetical protein